MAEQSLIHFKTSGISSDEAQRRFKEDGPNELVRATRRTALSVLLEVMLEPMFLLLLASSTIYFMLGETHEALMLSSMILLVIGITFYQQNKTERALEALKDLSSPRALVIRDGKTQRIAGREVVRGDWVVLTEGDRIPADGLLIDGPGLSADESLLTGESVAVRHEPNQPDSSALYAGTLVIQGQGTMEVQRIGMQTELGKVGHSLDSLVTEETLLKKEIRHWVRIFAGWGVLICIAVLLAYGLIRENWINGLLAGITLAMSILPEELPMVLTVFLALGAWRIAKKQVLTRHPQAIEALGAASVLCTDKTGTLTLNCMSLGRVVSQGENTPESQNMVLKYAALASDRQGLDPMDRSTLNAATQTFSADELGSFHLPARLYPLSKNFLALTIAWPQADNHYIIATKGAPETILNSCHLEQTEYQNILDQVGEMAQDGYRVLAVAKAHHTGSLPDSPQTFSFDFVGLLGYLDPIRPTVPEAIQECHAAGIRVIMITGDYPETARSIAKQIGLKSSENLLTGTMLNDLSDSALIEQIKSTNIFARMVPEQKLRLVNALKANGDIVAMTGDGVNDAPALKAAHIGIAMGKRGTDVAREAAQLVLLDDDFASIVQAIRMGRRIFDNLRKAIVYIFSIHIPIAGMTVIPVLLNWPLVLFPAHIAFLEMIIDPACSIAFEAEPSENDVMSRPPRSISEPLFNKKTFLQAVLQGNAVLFTVLATYGYVLLQGYGASDARTISFLTLVAANLMLITVSLSGKAPIRQLPFLKNKAYWWVMGGALMLQISILLIPAVRNLFHFNVLHPIDYAITLIAALVCLVALEILRYQFEFSKRVFKKE